MKNKDYSYFFTVSGISGKEAEKISAKCRRLKRKYASDGRGTSFTCRTSELGRHISANYRKKIEED